MTGLEIASGIVAIMFAALWFIGRDVEGEKHDDE